MSVQNNKYDLEELKRIPIQYYAEAVLGLTEWEQIGSNKIRPHLKSVIPDSGDFSSLVIDLTKNCFWRNSGKGNHTSGSIIDFVANTSDCSTKEAIDILVNFSNNDFSIDYCQKPLYNHNTVIKAKDLILPQKHKNDNRLYAYMTKRRKIEDNVYHYMIDNQYMYQSWDCYAVFVSYKDGIPVFACKRDTNWNERITYNISGSMSEWGFYIDNKSDTMVVTEAVVDAMAYQSLLYIQNKDYKNLNYLALTGAGKIKCIEYHLQNDANISKVILAFDNDKAGKTARTKTKTMLKQMQWNGKVIDYIPCDGNKDVNDVLIQKKAS